MADWYGVDVSKRNPRSGRVCVQACVICGSEFTYRPSKNDRIRAYCSRPCFYEGLRRFKGGSVLTGVPQPRQYTRTRQCEKCGATCESRTHNQRWCPTCAPDRTAQARLSRYNVSHPEWLAMVAKHGGKCWICREREPKAVDHCHRTGVVRGALCTGCNTQLHGVEDGGWLRQALTYLQEVSNGQAEDVLE